jgi:hypothetical protein
MLRPAQPNGQTQHVAASGLAGSWGTRTRTPLENAGETGVPQESGAESGAPFDDSAPVYPDLAFVVNAWPTLPEAVRAAVVALVQQAGG